MIDNSDNKCGEREKREYHTTAVLTTTNELLMNSGTLVTCGVGKWLGVTQAVLGLTFALMVMRGCY